MSARTAFGPSLSASALCASKQKLRFRDALQPGAGTMAEPCALEGEDRKQGRKRRRVAETTEAILGSMSKKPKKAPTELDEQPRLVKKRKKKKKLKRARGKVLEAAAAAKAVAWAEAMGGAGDEVGKTCHASGGKQHPPTVSLRDIRKKVQKAEEKRNAAAEQKQVQKLQGFIESLGKVRSDKSYSVPPSPMQLKEEASMEKLEM